MRTLRLHREIQNKTAQDYLGLRGRPEIKTARGVWLVLLIGWAPLPMLVLAQLLVRKDPAMLTFFSDFGVHARSLLAAPLLVVSEKICLPRLADVAEHFLSGGLVSESDRGRFESAVSSTKALAGSTLARLLAIVLSYVVVVALLSYLPPQVYPRWHSPAERGYPDLSWAAWWYAAVSLPLLLMTFCLWCWRIGCWIRFLFLVSRLKLCLVPAHPDGAGGLGFLDLTLFAFMPLAFILGLLFAGPLANQVLHKHASIASFRIPVIALVVIVVLVFVAPLVLFAANLRRQFRRGVMEYGGLAHEVGRQFEQKWFNRAIGPEALEVPDFSATTDLLSVVAYSEEMRLLPFDFRAVAYLIVVSLTPFVPVIFMTIPLSSIIEEAVKLLL